MITTEQLCGVLVLDKPVGWTSHDAVNKVRRLAKTKKVGHLGTLDPLATGVLPLVIGKATRLAQYFGKDRKRYETVVRFGYSTFTYDREGEPTSEARPVTLDASRMEALLEPFRGAFEQLPPPVSAKKIEGVPAYKLARKNQPVELKPVPVEVYSLEVMKVEGSDLHLRLECSPGTYVRSIAHELGKALGCGAFVQELRRTHSGEFGLDQAYTIEAVAELCEQERFDTALITGAQLLPQIPAEIVDALTEAQIRQGRDFRTSPFRVAKEAPLVKALNREGQILAIGERKLPNLYHPVLVLNN
jgi:tRNA pseudouridine55 synthase